MFRVIRYMTRPTLLAASAERRTLGIPLRHAQPNLLRLPANVRFPIPYAHPFYHEGTMRCLIFWEQRNVAWWMDVTLERWKRLPKITVTMDQYRW